MAPGPVTAPDTTPQEGNLGETLAIALYGPVALGHRPLCGLLRGIFVQVFGQLARTSIQTTDGIKTPAQLANRLDSASWAIVWRRWSKGEGKEITRNLGK